VALSAQLRFEANAKASFALRLLIKFDIGAMEPGRSFVAIKQNVEACAAASVAGEGDYYSVRTFIFGLREAPTSFKRTRSPGLSSIDVISLRLRANSASRRTTCGPGAEPACLTATRSLRSSPRYLLRLLQRRLNPAVFSFDFGCGKLLTLAFRPMRSRRRRRL